MDYFAPACASAPGKPGGIEEENEMTLRMMDKYGWWNVRGGSWCQVDIHIRTLLLICLQHLSVLVLVILLLLDSAGKS